MKSLLNRRPILTGSYKRLKKYNICYSWLIKTSKILNKYSEIKDEIKGLKYITTKIKLFNNEIKIDLQDERLPSEQTLSLNIC